MHSDVNQQHKSRMAHIRPVCSNAHSLSSCDCKNTLLPKLTVLQPHQHIAALLLTHRAARAVLNVVIATDNELSQRMQLHFHEGRDLCAMQHLGRKEKSSPSAAMAHSFRRCHAPQTGPHRCTMHNVPSYCPDMRPTTVTVN